ncbi:UDP-phosphate glucose phosphotransferase [Brevundimonas sp. Leaf363]|uniref:exopolysaccharide biosynthesis polyprenyl glycosylphosphotransferase n=1 Tax=Brevundimonas sp. Leaf363 TaxID=1736353 RepID=UPI0006F6E06F|nr:exopolysaccharide biosynthesis polyprenyl glycosylphosphotransferase [Brevundimonas sp. Leaf363]KQS55864.1 UDP-phosphate glucose phosphotransferase [Brevundimonas sp. Leaf363]
MPDCAAYVSSPAATQAGPDAVGAQARRGPFRPAAWLNTRQRQSARLASHLFRLADVLTVGAVTVAVAWAAAPVALVHAPLSSVLPFVLAAVCTLSLVRSAGLYRFARTARPARHFAALLTCVLAGAAVLIVSGLAFGDPVGAYSLWIIGALASLIGLHAVWFTLVAHWRASGALTPNVVLVGATRHAERLVREALNRRDLNILGVFDDRLARSPNSVAGAPVLGDAEALLSHRILPYVDHIVVAIDPRAGARISELTRRLSVLPNEVSLLVDMEGETQRGEALERLALSPLASLDGADADRRAFNKRAQDVVLGAVALVALAPVMAVTALLIRLDSPGPIFFRQRRHGFNQEEIVVWKFRTMKHAAADATASRQVTVDDDRVTALGKILRATSLDELPQLWNVVTGEMSLVGPRPHAIGMKTGETESARLVAEYAHRHRIKPGMTGWAAIKGSRGPLHCAQDVRRRVQLDIDYVERQSLWLDLWIMLVTLPVLLGDRQGVR